MLAKRHWGFQTKKMEKAMTFSSVLKSSIYANRNVLYGLIPPNGFVHRIEEKNELVMELAPILMNSVVNCIFVFGNPGTGKTGVMMELMGELEKEAEKTKVNLKTVYVNCSENRTETSILIDILSRLNLDEEYPRMGWTRAKAIDELNKILNKEETNVLIVLDEVDYALKESGDDILYRLSRINDKIKSRVSTIIISNDVKVGDYIKPRTQSTFGRVKIVFSPYTSDEMFDILRDRSKYAFKKNVIGDTILRKIAEIEASRGGDARKALELLDGCAKIAIAKNANKISLEYVDEADRNLERDVAIKTLMGLAKHQKILFLAMLKNDKGQLNSDEAYKNYKEECPNYDVEPLTERRVRSFLVEMGDLGLIDQEIGWLRDLKKKTRKINLNIDNAVKNKVRKLLRDSI